MVSATITDAKVCKISKLWRKKPLGLSFAETDAVILTLETPDGKKITETFYVGLKADGTFSTAAISKGRGSRARQKRFADFLTRYKITKDVKSFNVKKSIGDLKGKKVEVVPYKGSGYIRVP
ncbi:MAG: hypothetical protein QMD00_03945 [Hadesarchaea archaeon]|nr:hypothetical protein [Hadesarchaea archaeon]